MQRSGEVAELRLGTAIGGDDDGAAILVGLDAGDQLALILRELLDGGLDLVQALLELGLRQRDVLYDEARVLCRFAQLGGGLGVDLLLSAVIGEDRGDADHALAEIVEPGAAEGVLEGLGPLAGLAAELRGGVGLGDELLRRHAEVALEGIGEAEGDGDRVVGVHGAGGGGRRRGFVGGVEDLIGGHGG